MGEELIENLTNSIDTSPTIPDADTLIATQLIYKYRFDEATLSNFVQNLEARRKYSHRIFIITSGWLLFVIAILFLVGLKFLFLSDSVLIALLGTTTVNVSGFLLLLFNIFLTDKNQHSVF